MSSGLRFKFNGSTVQVSIGSGSAKTITDITEADPAVVTSTAHGLALGTVGRIAAVVGMTELNGRLFVVDNPDTGDFELAGVDASAYTPYVSGGTFTPLGDNAANDIGMMVGAGVRKLGQGRRK